MMVKSPDLARLRYFCVFEALLGLLNSIHIRCLPLVCRVFCVPLCIKREDADNLVFALVLDRNKLLL